MFLSNCPEGTYVLENSILFPRKEGRTELNSHEWKFFSYFHHSSQVQIIPFWLFLIDRFKSPLFSCLSASVTSAFHASTRHWRIMRVERRRQDSGSRVLGSTSLCASQDSLAVASLVPLGKAALLGKGIGTRECREQSLNASVISECPKISTAQQKPTLLGPTKPRVSVPGTFSLTFII